MWDDFPKREEFPSHLSSGAAVQVELSRRKTFSNVHRSVYLPSPGKDPVMLWKDPGSSLNGSASYLWVQQVFCSSVSWPRTKDVAGVGGGACADACVDVCVFSFPLPLSSWQQQLNENRNKGTIHTMRLSYCPCPCPQIWEGLCSAVRTALPQTRPSSSRQVSYSSCLSFNAVLA